MFPWIKGSVHKLTAALKLNLCLRGTHIVASWISYNDIFTLNHTSVKDSITDNQSDKKSKFPPVLYFKVINPFMKHFFTKLHHDTADNVYNLNNANVMLL